MLCIWPSVTYHNQFYFNSIIVLDVSRAWKQGRSGQNGTGSLGTLCPSPQNTFKLNNNCIWIFPKYLLYIPRVYIMIQIHVKCSIVLFSTWLLYFIFFKSYMVFILFNMLNVKSINELVRQIIENKL